MDTPVIVVVAAHRMADDRSRRATTLGRHGCSLVSYNNNNNNNNNNRAVQSFCLIRSTTLALVGMLSSLFEHVYCFSSFDFDGQSFVKFLPSKHHTKRPHAL